MWFLGPKRPVHDVAEEIVNGLRDGTVVLSAPLRTDVESWAAEAGRPDDTPHPSHSALLRSADSPTDTAHKAGYRLNLSPPGGGVWPTVPRASRRKSVATF